MSLAGKVAIVTGGGTGIGLGIARVLAARGVKLALAQRTLAHVEKAAQELAPAEALPLAVDISDPDAVERMTEQVVARFGAVDILVNNASMTGATAISSFLDCTPELLNRIVDINLKGTFWCSQAAARRMRAAGRGGCIIHVTSVGAWAAQELASAYCATKAAQASLAQSMGLELAPYGIRVVGLAPGDIFTEASSNIREDVKASSGTGKYLRITPLGRCGTPEEIGNVVAFLASDEASFITGTTVRVDGGFLAY
jgi:NAD(P)-dependent dehydrogenase (short-subunit alcohol dehydrogenase family)